MVSPAGRITKFNQKEVDQLFKKSHRILHSPEATILAAPRDKESDLARLLIVISRAVGNSVERHLLRRRLKSIFYQQKLFEQLKYDIVIIAKKPIVALDFAQLSELFLKAIGTIL